MACGIWDLIPSEGLKPGPQQCKRGVGTTGLLGNAPPAACLLEARRSWSRARLVLFTDALWLLPAPRAEWRDSDRVWSPKSKILLIWP